MFDRIVAEDLPHFSFIFFPSAMEVQVDREVVRFLVVVDCVDRFEW